MNNNITEIGSPSDVIKNAHDILDGDCPIPKIKAANTVMSGTDWPAILSAMLDKDEEAIKTMMVYLAFVQSAVREALNDSPLTSPYIKGNLLYNGPSTNIFGNN